MRCPQCGSNNIQKTPIRSLLLISFLATSGILTLFGIFFFPLLFISIPMFLASFIILALPLPRFKCVECNQAYTKKKVTA